MTLLILFFGITIFITMNGGFAMKWVYEKTNKPFYGKVSVLSFEALFAFSLLAVISGEFTTGESIILGLTGGFGVIMGVGLKKQLRNNPQTTIETFYLAEEIKQL